jgi:hypothetical protein
MKWLRIDIDMCNNTKVLYFGRLIRHQYPEALLLRLWSWCVTRAPEGDISRFDPTEIAIACNYDGDGETLISAMLKAGLLDQVEDGLVIHGWYERQGVVMNRGRRDAERHREFRQRQKADEVETSLESHEDVLKTSCGRRGLTITSTKTNTNHEERVAPLHVASEIDRVAPPHLAAAPPQAGPADESPAAPKEQYPSDFVAFWQSYRRPAGKGSKPAALREWRKLNAAYRGLAIKELATFQASKDWQKESGQYIPHAERYLKLQLFLSPPEPGNGNGRDSPGHDPNCPWCRGTGIKINHLLSGDVEAPCTCRR